jgi:large subunit ribosomal protein L25
MEFQAVSMSESVTSAVPIRFVGEPPAVTRLNGILTHPRTQVHVTARASELPESIEVDLSTITELHGAIHVSDLPESATYKVIDAPDDVLAMVEAPKEEAAALEAGAEQPAEAPAAAEREAEAEPETGSSSEAESA